jgi:hypothetical protein
MSQIPILLGVFPPMSGYHHIPHANVPRSITQMFRCGILLAVRIANSELTAAPKTLLASTRGRFYLSARTRLRKPELFAREHVIGPSHRGAAAITTHHARLGMRGDDGEIV